MKKIIGIILILVILFASAVWTQTHYKVFLINAVQYAFLTPTAFMPASDALLDLGAVGGTDYRWKNLYLSGDLSDETNALSVAEINTAYLSRVPVGAIMPYGAAAAPTGWLLCNGAAVNRTTYSALFAIIGETYGVGDGSSTFNVPDFASQFIRGNTPAATGGADTNSHYHNTGVGWDAGNETYMRGDLPKYGSDIATDTVHKGTIGDAASAGLRDARTSTPSDTENMPAYLGVNFIIKY